MSDEKQKRNLKITSCVERKRGGGGTTGRKEWVLYTVGALNEDGIPIDLELRSWVKLEPSDKVLEFFVERKEFQGEVSYELTPIRKLSLGERVEQAERRIAELTERVERLESGAPDGAPAPAASPGSPVW